MSRSSRSSRSTGTATILFADVVESTALTLATGDERAHDVVSEYAEVVREAAAAYGANRLRQVGDGFMLVFPGASDAVDCACDIQTRISSIALANPDAARPMRMGLNTGDVIYEPNDVYGAAANAAARMCSEAEPGQILASETVRAVASQADGAQFVPRGERRLKGFPEAWAIYEVRTSGGGSSAERFSAALRRPTPLVGRERELDELRARLDAAAHGHGSFTAVVGPPGIGKTRLVDQLSTLARERGLEVLVGACSEEGQTGAYQPVVDALRPVVAGQSDAELRRTLGDAAPWMRQLIPAQAATLAPAAAAPEPAGAGLPPEREREVVERALIAGLVALGERTPLLLVLEDLHWADATTEHLLMELARVVPAHRIALVGTYRRTTFTGGDGLDALARLCEKRRATIVDVGGLGRDELARLVHAMAGSAPPDAVLDEVLAETDGNPFLVEEVLRYRHDRGSLFDDGGEWRTGSGAAPPSVPPAVGLVLGRRLGTLAPRTRELLARAAIVGRTFDAGLLLSVAGRGESASEDPAALDALDEAERSGMIEGRQSARRVQYRFVHDLFRQTLYAEQAPDRLADGHLHVGERLWQLREEGEEVDAATVARHYEAAGDRVEPAKARRCYLLAADEYLAGYSAEAAIHAYEMALGTADIPPVEQGRTLERLGHAQRSAGRHAEAVVSLERAVETAKQAGDEATFEQACYALTQIHLWRGEYFGAAEAAARSLDAGPTSTPTAAPASASHSRCRLLALAGSVHCMGGDEEGGRALTDRAMRIARESGDRKLLATTLVDRGYQDSLYTRFGASLEALEEAERLLRAAGDDWMLCECLVHQLTPLGQMAEHDRLAATIDVLAEMTEPLGHPGVATGAAAAAALWLTRGDLEAAAEHTRRAQRASKGAARRVYPVATHVLAELVFLSGDVAQAAELHAEACAANAEIGDPQDWYQGPLSLLRWRALVDAEAAAAEADEQVALLLGNGGPATRARADALTTAGEAVAITGHEDHARAIYEPLRGFTYNGLAIGGVSYPLVQRVLGMLAATFGDDEGAQRHYDLALREAEKVNGEKEAAETRFWLGGLLAGRRDTESRSRGARLIDDACERYERIGMRVHAERARRSAARL